jgi:hypothetical protein
MVDAGAARRPDRTQVTCSGCGFVFHATVVPSSGMCRRCEAKKKAGAAQPAPNATSPATRDQPQKRETESKLARHAGGSHGASTAPAVAPTTGRPPERKAALRGEAQRQSGNCWVCNKPGHRGDQCPMKGRVQTFVASVMGAESIYGSNTELDASGPNLFPMSSGPEHHYHGNILRAKVRYCTPDGFVKWITVGLDTCCDHDIFAPGVAVAFKQGAPLEANVFGGHALGTAFDTASVAEGRSWRLSLW